MSKAGLGLIAEEASRQRSRRGLSTDLRPDVYSKASSRQMKDLEDEELSESELVKKVQLSPDLQKKFKKQSQFSVIPSDCVCYYPKDRL